MRNSGRCLGKWLRGVLLWAAILSVVYVALSLGVIERAYGLVLRGAIQRGLVSAMAAEPPDVAYLLGSLRSPDWSIAAEAAEDLGRAWDAGRLPPEQNNLVVQSLLGALGRGGHWWRFGWDTDEPEFNQFRGAATYAVARFGDVALPSVAKALTNSNAKLREEACWILVAMLQMGKVSSATLVDQGISNVIATLARSDSHESVRAACSCADDSLR